VSFDNLTDRYLSYDIDQPKEALQRLTNTLTATLASENTDSPIFKMLPTLPEVDPASVQVLPQDLAEEVDRAEAAKAAGWLRLLSQEVETRRFQWPAMRVIGQARWDIADSEGARRTYQKLIDNDADDLDENGALANLYERQCRREKRAELLAASDHAIKRVLANNRATQAQHTEALSLTGRNAKTRWRQAFEGLPSFAERRKAVTNRQLIEAYEGIPECVLRESQPEAVIAELGNPLRCAWILSCDRRRPSHRRARAQGNPVSRKRSCGGQRQAARKARKTQSERRGDPRPSLRRPGDRGCAESLASRARSVCPCRWTTIRRRSSRIWTAGARGSSPWSGKESTGCSLALQL
jgi:hypothetical protein